MASRSETEQEALPPAELLERLYEGKAALHRRHRALPLREKVRSVGRRVGRLVLLHGLAWLVGAFLLVAFLLGLADYLLRVQDFGVRLIGWLGLVAVVCAGFYYVVYPALVFNPTDLEIARRLERFFPQLSDRLSSALAFLDQSEDDPLAGSAALRRASSTAT